MRIAPRSPASVSRRDRAKSPVFPAPSHATSGRDVPTDQAVSYDGAVRSCGSRAEVAGSTPRRFDSTGEAARELIGVTRGTAQLWRAYRGGLSPALRERVMVAVSRANACAGCTQVHQRWALRAGVSDAELDALGLGELARLGARDRAAVVFAVERAQQRFVGSPSPEVAAAAGEHLSPGELDEVDAIARAMTFANLTVSTIVGPRVARRHGDSHPIFARVWARVAPLVGSDEQRSELLGGLRGRVLEVGAGEGRNFAYYPAGVSKVVAVEPERYLRQMASEAAIPAPVAVQVLDGKAEALPAGDDSCDAVVTSLVLCSVPDQRVALGELRRVLVVGGELRFFEHVVAHNALVAGAQRWLDRTGIWPRLGAGCHLSRDTVGAIESAGFAVEALRRIPSGPGPLGIPFVLGRARLP